MPREIRITLDGPPGAEPGRFVDVHDETGAGIRVGRWEQRSSFIGPTYWDLVLEPGCFDDAEQPDPDPAEVDVADITELGPAMTSIAAGHIAALFDRTIAYQDPAGERQIARPPARTS